jgi:hypothetical protein
MEIWRDLVKAGRITLEDGGMEDICVRCGKGKKGYAINGGVMVR